MSSSPLRKLINVFIPSGEVKTLEGVETWQVQYNKRVGTYINPEHTDVTPVGKLFTNRADAEAFANALMDAYRLTENHVDCKYVEVSKMAN